MRHLARWLDHRLHYAWIVLAVTVLVLLAVAGIRAASSVMIIPLEQDFGWSRDEVSGSLAVGLLIFGLAAPFAAALMQRFGVRMVVSVSLAIVASGAGISLFMSKPWHLMATWGAMLGLGGGTIAVVLGAVITNRWFVSHRGLVNGIFLASMAAGQLVFLPAFAWIAQTSGWRPVALLCFIGGFAVIPLVLMLVPEQPRDVGLRPVGAAADYGADRSATRNPIGLAFETLRSALPTRTFWVLGGSFLICGLTTAGLVGTHLIPMCFDAGVPQVMGAGLLAMMGIFNMAGTTIAGWASDRWDNRWLLMGFFASRGVSLIFLPYSDYTVMSLTVFSVIYGLDWFATAPATIRLLTDTYGKTAAPILFGWIFVLHQIGSALAAWGAGVMRGMFGSYLEAFVFAGITCFVAAALVLTVRQSGLRANAA
jgi:MFS family permease